MSDSAKLMVMSSALPEILPTLDPPAWCDPRHIAVAWAVGDGFTITDAAKVGGVSRRTVYDWLEKPEFRSFIDRCTFHSGLAGRPERVRLVKKQLRELEKKGVDAFFKKHDGIDGLRYIAELVGDGGAGPLPASVQVVREVLANIQVNVSVSGGGDPVASSSAAVIEGDVRDITENGAKEQK